MLDLPPEDLDATLAFWAWVTGSTVSPWRGDDDEFATLLPADGDAHLRVQRFPGGPRVHLDLHVRALPSGGPAASSDGRRTVGVPDEAVSHEPLPDDPLPNGDPALGGISDEGVRMPPRGSVVPDEAADRAVRAELVRALALGAALEHDAGTHAVLSSPGGFVFCLVRDAGHAHRTSPVPVVDVGHAHRPSPASVVAAGDPGAGHVGAVAGDPGAERVVPGGDVAPDPGIGATDDEPGPATAIDGRPAAALVDQLCLDVPADRFDAEAAFWPALTGWAAGEEGPDGLLALHRPPGVPLRLLLQRLGDDDPRREVTAHLDLATVARPVVERAHVAAGARVVRRYERWTTLLDPSGRPYCLTDRDPLTGYLPA